MHFNLPTHQTKDLQKGTKIEYYEFEKMEFYPSLSP